MARMMDTLERMEEKIDNMSITGGRPGSSQMTAVPGSSSHQTPASAHSDRDERSLRDAIPPRSETSSETPPYFAAPHRTVVWPTIYSQLTRFVPQAIPQLAALSEGGTSWLLCVWSTGGQRVLRPR